MDRKKRPREPQEKALAFWPETVYHSREKMTKQYKLDLHTHSILSKDGGITKSQYETVLQEKILDFVAITDHNAIELALSLRKKLGSKIIVGEEVKTKQGELVGLFIKKFIRPGLGVKETIGLIRLQGGLVFLPHPFGLFRRGIEESFLEEIIFDVDIIEVFNARALVNSVNERALDLAKRENKAYAASSDAHCVKELGQTCTWIGERPTRENLVSLLSAPRLETKKVGFGYRFCPALNRLKRLLTQ